MKLLFDEYGSAALAMIGALAVMGFTWAIMFGTQDGGTIYHNTAQQSETAEVDYSDMAESLSKNKGTMSDTVGNFFEEQSIADD